MSKWPIGKLRVLGPALSYALVFHYSYTTYINPVFEYAHYGYFPPSLLGLLLTYFLIAAPIAMYRDSLAPAAHGVSLIFALCYVPAQLILRFTWERPQIELQFVQMSLAASMAVLFWASRRGWRLRGPVYTIRRLSLPLLALTVASLVMLVVVYRDHMRLVSFADVYEVRFESSEVETGALVDYPLLWLSYSFLPFYLARGILRKSAMDISLALLGSVLIYAASGSKASILMPLIVFGMYVLLGNGRHFLQRVLLALTCGVLVVIAAVPNEGILLWVKSILLVRVLGTGGWSIATYYDFFSANGHTFYTHIGPVNAMTGAYPYGELSLGQVIGLEYSGSIEANFNAGFWASDAFAALGIAGVPVVTLALSAVLCGINRLSAGYSPRFVTLWLAGFWLALLNIPLTTALLSGGGGITMVLLWWARQKRPRNTVAVCTPKLLERQS